MLVRILTFPSAFLIDTHQAKAQTIISPCHCCYQWPLLCRWFHAVSCLRLPHNDRRQFSQRLVVHEWGKKMTKKVFTTSLTDAMVYPPQVHFGAPWPHSFTAVLEGKFGDHRLHRKIALEGHRFTAPEALADGILDYIVKGNTADVLAKAEQVADQVSDNAARGVWGLIKVWHDSFLHIWWHCWLSSPRYRRTPTAQPWRKWELTGFSRNLRWMTLPFTRNCNQSLYSAHLTCTERW